MSSELGRVQADDGATASHGAGLNQEQKARELGPEVTTPAGPSWWTEEGPVLMISHHLVGEERFLP